MSAASKTPGKPEIQARAAFGWTDLDFAKCV
jgi:hypothetical protein